MKYALNHEDKIYNIGDQQYKAKFWGKALSG